MHEKCTTVNATTDYSDFNGGAWQGGTKVVLKEVRDGEWGENFPISLVRTTEEVSQKNCSKTSIVQNNVTKGRFHVTNIGLSHLA